MSAISNTLIKTILEKATYSPSGDNSQPWSFVWDGTTLHIFHNYGRGLHPLNTKNFASLLALGTLIESLDLVASENGFSIDYTLGEITNDNTIPWIHLTFNPGPRPPQTLAKEIHNRWTDRDPYHGGAISASNFGNVFERNEFFSPAQFHFVSKITPVLADYIAKAETLLFGDFKTLSSTLKWVRFSSNHALKTRDGMIWRNMGIRIWELPSIPLLRDFSIISKILGPILKLKYKWEVKKQITSSAGLVCVSVPEATPQNLIKAGRMMMTAWLSLTRDGLNAQPFTTSSLIAYGFQHGLFPLYPQWQEYFERSSAILRAEFNIPDGQHPVWILRTGKGRALPEPIRTHRLPIENIVQFRNL